MINFGLYLIKSGISLLLFYAVYWLFLRKVTFFRLNRFILLSSVILSLTLPFIDFSRLFWSEEVNFVSIIGISYNYLVNTIPSRVLDTGQADLTYFSLLNIAVIFYFIGVTIVFSKLIYQSIRIFSMIKRDGIIQKDGMKIIFSKEDYLPFSYLDYIFISKSDISIENIHKILSHEKAHIKQYHFIDLIFIELLTAFLWINPFIWFYRKSIKEIHEYLADNAVITKGCVKANYQALLVNQVVGMQMFTMANSFNKNLIKNRIIMMTKMKTPKAAGLKILLFLPVITFLVFAFSEPDLQGYYKTDQPGIKISGTVIDINTGDPLPGATITIKGTNNGTITDKQGEFNLDITDKEVTLVISFIGYKSREINVKDSEMLIIKMETGIENIKQQQDKNLVNTDPGKTVVLSENEEVVTVFGKVTENKTSDALPGVHIILLGTTTGTISDSEGNYSLNVYDPEAILVFSFVGYITEKIKVNNKTVINAKMEVGNIIIDFSKGNSLVAQEFLKEDNNTDNREKEIYVVVEDMPGFPGGTDAIKKIFEKKQKYPVRAKKNNIEGEVWVSFIVNKEGIVKEASIMKGVDPDLDKEALRLVNSLPHWKPGSQNGKPVKVRFTVPVSFIL